MLLLLHKPPEAVGTFKLVKILDLFNYYCSDYRNGSNGIFVLGVVFFSSDNFRLFN